MYKRSLTARGQPQEIAPPDAPLLLPKVFAFWGALTVGVWVFPAMMPVVGLGLAAYALRGPKAAIQALTVLFFLLYLNPLIAIRPALMTLRWLVLAAAFGRVVWDSLFDHSEARVTALPQLFLFAIVVFILTLLASYGQLISILKLISFTVGVVVVLTSFHRTRHLRAYWLAWFFTLFFFTGVASLPFYGTEIGYARGALGFQGITNHPQAFGPLMVPLTAWLMGRIFFMKDRSWVMIAGVSVGWFSIFTSLSRTSPLAIFISFVITLCLGLVHPRWRHAFKSTYIRPLPLLFLGVMMGLLWLQWPTFQEYTAQILLKKTPGLSYEEAFQLSRGRMIEASMNNFRKEPLTGIGFGVPSEFTFSFYQVRTNNVLGLPMSAFVEKGFLPSALLEEIGITGMIVFLVFILALMRPVLARGDPALFWMFTACLAINVGEMVFFSIGGFGLYLWLLIGFATVCSTDVPEETTR